MFTIAVKLSLNVRFNQDLFIIYKCIIFNYSNIFNLYPCQGIHYKFSRYRDYVSLVFYKAPKIAVHQNENYKRYFLRMLVRVFKKCLTTYIKKIFFRVQTHLTYTAGSEYLSTLDKKENVKGKLELQTPVFNETLDSQQQDSGGKKPWTLNHFPFAPSIFASGTYSYSIYPEILADYSPNLIPKSWI